MGQPKKRTTHRRTGARRSHLVLKLARQVNARSKVKAYTTRKETGKKTASNKSAPKTKSAALKKS